MSASVDYVRGPWRYERLTGVGHWIPTGAPDRLNALLLDFLADPARR
jgi:pimeloyl-ACP methyl ester carboxylesterase